MTARGSVRGNRVRRGAANTWLVLALSGISAGVLVVHLERRVAAAGFHEVDPARFVQRPGANAFAIRAQVVAEAGATFDDEFGEAAGSAEIRAAHWWDERWRRELEWELASTPPFAIDDAEARASLRERITALSFVAEVRAGAAGEVVWPDGLSLALRIERPAACVKIGGRFQTVSDRGVLLTGAWTAPPEADGGTLPVLGPNDGRMDGARPGDLLAQPHEYAALSIALSLRRHLDAADRARLGRFLIDARRAHLTAPDEPGARLLLEGGREIYWGRAPSAGEPGELPPSIKWAHVVRGLDALDQGFDWRTLDVRWDRPAMDRGAFATVRNEELASEAASGALLPLPDPKAGPASAAPARRPRASSGVR